MRTQKNSQTPLSKLILTKAGSFTPVPLNTGVNEPAHFRRFDAAENAKAARNGYLLAGLMIFPAAFSVGVQPDSGPSLIFITLPNVFQQAFSGVPFVGFVVSLAFYALMSLAALTSLISLHEVSTAFFQEEMRISRRRSATIVSVATAAIGIFCSLSLGGVEWLTFGGMSLFDIFDFVTGQVFLPIVGFFSCIFIGWYVPKSTVCDEFTNWGTLRTTLFPLFLFCVRFVCPTAILIIFLNQLNII